MQQINAQTVKLVGPNKDIIRMTEKILKQNDLILKMNMDLLKTFSNPFMILDGQSSG